MSAYTQGEAKVAYFSTGRFKISFHEAPLRKDLPVKRRRYTCREKYVQTLPCAQSCQEHGVAKRKTSSRKKATDQIKKNYDGSA